MVRSTFSNSLEHVITETPSISPQKLIDDLNVSSVSSVSSSSDSSNYLLYFLLVAILLLLGFNLFNYLGEGAESLKDLFSPILGFFGYSVGETAKKTISESQKGTKFAVDIIGDSVKDAIDVSEQILDPNFKSLKRDININNKKPNKFPEPDDSGSLLQKSKPKSKSGFCYIGEDRGFRSCISVDKSELCMSGEIFPSKQICINPSLRE
jgi:hypothetical protein